MAPVCRGCDAEALGVVVLTLPHTEGKASMALCLPPAALVPDKADGVLPLVVGCVGVVTWGWGHLGRARVLINGTAA